MPQPTTTRRRSRNLDIEDNRLRLALTIYDPETRSYRSSTDLSVRLSVASQTEIRQLWRAIVAVVEGKDWTDARPGATPPRRGASARAVLAAEPA